MMYHVCQKCGANLDPGEKCDCQKSKTESNSKKNIRRDKKKD